MNRNATAGVTILVALVIGAVVALAGSDGGVDTAGLPVIVWCAIVAFGVNWAVFVPSYLARSERFYDLTGTVSYLGVTTLALVLVGRYEPGALLLGALVAIWSLRLGTFLFRRILADGSDGRFDELKTRPLPFLQTWTLQGLWVLLTLAAALGAITAADQDVPIGPLAIVGVGVWIGGFAIEALADHQKHVFRQDPDNDGEFITTGLWAWSRHPNYFGEITLWVGVALIALPALDGWRYVTLISPVFVFVLLRYISGVPLLEKRGAKRWGDDPRYEEYVASTPVLWPRPPSKGDSRPPSTSETSR